MFLEKNVNVHLNILSLSLNLENYHLKHYFNIRF